MVARFIILSSCLILGIVAHYQGNHYLPPAGHTQGNLYLPPAELAMVGPDSYVPAPVPLMHHSRRPAVVSGSAHSHVHHNRNCRASIHCPNAFISPTYATDGLYCHKFNNSCQLAHANCERRNALKHMLKHINRHECRRLPRISSPF